MIVNDQIQFSESSEDYRRVGMKNDFEMEMVLTVESMMSRVQATGLVCVDAKVVDRHGTGKVES